MNLKDNISKEIRGDFSIDVIDNNNSITDNYSEKNLIMDLGRYSIANSVAGFTDYSPIITKLVLGTLGWTGDVSTPIDAGTNGFVSSRTNLFSEAASGYYTYTIPFTPTSNGSYATVTGQAGTDGVTVKITQVANIITYEVLLSLNAANGTGRVNYTEAAFYCGNNIFAMKTYPVKVKDSSCTIKITWSFTF